jgi:hypothetical protein
MLLNGTIGDCPARDPAQPVRALICGYGPQDRERYFGMYVAHVDESGTGQEFVVFGCLVGTPAQWLQFSTDWQAALDKPPSIKHFSYHEASVLEEEFGNFSGPERDQRLRELWGILNKYATRGDLAVVHNSTYRSIFDGTLGKTHDNPLHFGYMNTLLMSTKEIAESEAPGPIDFIFDDMDDTQYLEIIQAFRQLKTTHDIPLGVRACLGEDPIRRNDKKLLPLQAADLWAGIMRHAFQQITPVHPKMNPITDELLRSAGIPNRAFVWDFERLAKIRTGLAAKIPFFGTRHETRKERSKRLKQLRNDLLSGRNNLIKG